MRRFLVVFGVLGAAGGVIGAGIVAWRRNPRIGTRFVNDVVNPILVRRGFAGSGRSEVGTLEHVGRRSGVRRLTPVHPEPTADGFRIVVPLGRSSEWAANVVAAGHCRLQLHDSVYELDEPRIVTPDEVTELPRLLRRLETALGFEYLLLHEFAAGPGALEPLAGEARVPEVAPGAALPAIDAEEALEPGAVEVLPAG